MNIRYSKALDNGSFLELNIHDGDSVKLALDEFAAVEAAALAALQRDLGFSPASQGISAGKFRDLVAETQAARAETPEPKAPSEEEAIGAMQELVKRHGAEGVAQAVAVLKSFGVARVTELAAEQRGAFIEKARAA